MSLAGMTPGSTRDAPASTVTDAPNRSLPVKDFRISALALPNAL